MNLTTANRESKLRGGMAAVAPERMERGASVPLCEPVACCTDCVTPVCCFGGDSCYYYCCRGGPHGLPCSKEKAEDKQDLPLGYCLWPSHKVLAKDEKRKKYLAKKFDYCHRLDRFTLRHPCWAGCCCVARLSELHASVYLGGSFYRNYESAFGENYCCGQKVVVSEPALLEESLTSPAGRGFCLHMYGMRESALKHNTIGGETAFLLALPNDDDPNSQHARLRQLMFAHCTGDAAAARARVDDPVMGALLWDLRGKVASDPENTTNLHFPTFIVRAIHYCLLNLELDDETFDLVFRANVTPLDAGEFPPHGSEFLLAAPNLMGDDKVAHLPALHAKIEKAYAAALVKAGFESDFCTALEFGRALVPIMALAGVFGPLDALLNLFPEHHKWSKLAKPLEAAPDFAWPWDDRDKLRLCLLEAQRLGPGVYGTTQVSRTSFKAVIAGERVAFPAGTKMMLNYRNYGKREDVFGADPAAWRPYDRAKVNWGPEARCPFFNSVGDRTAGADAAAAAGLHPRACGRICPGRDLALELLASALQVLRAPTDDDAKRVLGR